VFSMAAAAMLPIIGFFDNFAKQSGPELIQEGEKIIESVFQGTQKNTEKRLRGTWLLQWQKGASTSCRAAYLP
jgi:hypothetical protein